MHDEACRWEHVMSEAVERRLLDLLGHPTHSPYGNPIPGLRRAGRPGRRRARPRQPVALTDLPATVTSVVVRRIGESLQTDLELLAALDQAGIRPGAPAEVSWTGDRVSIGLIGSDGDRAELDRASAAHLFVTRP